MRDWRPDGHLVCRVAKRVLIGEHTRGSDTQAGFEDRHNEYKSKCYEPWRDHLITVLRGWGWEAGQQNWTTGVRGLIPEREWEVNLAELGLDEKAGRKIKKAAFREAIEGGVDVLIAYGVAEGERRAQLRGEG